MKRTLVFVWRKEHVDLLQTRSNLSNLIVSLNLDVSVLLRELKFPYHEMTDYVDTATIRTLMEDAVPIADTWFQSIEADCKIDGISPLKVEALALASFIADGLIAKQLFDIISTKYAVEKLLLFDHPKEHIVITENGVDVDLWSAVWRVLAGNKHMPVEIIPVEKTGKTPRPSGTDRLKIAGSSIVKLFRNWTAWQRLFLREMLRRKKTALFVPMINESYRYAQLYDEIARSLALIPAALGARRTGGIQFKGYTWRYHALALIPTLHYLRLRASAKQLYERFLVFQQTYKGDYPELFANPYLAPQFRLLFLHFVPNSLQVYDDARTIFRRMNTKVVITSTFPMLHAASVHAAAQAEHVEILSLPHSGSPTDKDLRLKGNKTLIWTQDFVRTWHSTQGDTPLILTGLHPSIISQGYEQTQSWHPSERERKRITLLLATNQVGIRQWADMREHYETLARVAQVPSHLQSKVEVIFKLHPTYDYRYLYESLLPPQVDYIKIVRNVPIETILRESDLTVLVNITTSAHLLALEQGIPLLYVNTVQNSIIADLLAISDWSTDMVISDSTQIWQRIEQILFDSSALQRLISANQEYWKRLEAAAHNPVTVIRDTLALYLQ